MSDGNRVDHHTRLELDAPPAVSTSTRRAYVTPCLMRYGPVTSITGSMQATSLVDTKGGTAGNMRTSDRRLKSEIVRIGKTAHGLDLYEYDIAGRRERGVMADEVERLMPAAVSVRADGYQRVDYDMIGVPRPRRDVELLTRASYPAAVA